MQGIVKTIHQIWSDKYMPLPNFCVELAKTWRENHPDWEYILWDEEMITSFVKNEYPDYYEKYNNFTYDMQRWDIIRFFILKKMGGVHVDVDYECLENIMPLIENARFAIAVEPDFHNKHTGFDIGINSALMYSVPNHFFLDKVIDNVFSNTCFMDPSKDDKLFYSLKTTGPDMLTELYDSLSPLEKQDIKLLLAKYVAPFDHRQLGLLKAGIENDELESCLNEAYAIHYYTYLWR